ncbi:DUF6984 family protein [Spirosoma areae]
MALRRLLEDEKRLIAQLLKVSDLKLGPEWMENILVEPMNDGGMGSLKFFSNDPNHISRKFERKISEIQFSDTDNVLVLVSLNLDSFGQLYELDVWKTDFSPLIKIPESFG